MTDTIEFEVAEQSQISEARRRIVQMSADYGLDVASQDRVALIVTELGTNLIKHCPTGGRLLAHGLTNSKAQGIEVFSIDPGPGMDTEDCIVDGFSTTKTFGNGLGAAKRVSDEFDIYSQFGKGSVVNVRFWTKDSKPSESAVGGISVPKKGEVLSGDKWFIERTAEGFSCLLVDGLGHGFEACEAARLAVKRFKENLKLSPAEALKILHAALRGTRGAVGAIAKINFEKGKLDYCGLGNISGIVMAGNERKHLTSLNGTLGYEARKFLEVTLPWTPESILMMHSDGIASAASEDLERTRDRTASLIAAWLFQRHGKKIDDATVLVVKGVKW